MRAAYDALDDAMRERIAGLAAYHSLKYSQARAGFAIEPGARLLATASTRTRRRCARS